MGSYIMLSVNMDADLIDQIYCKTISAKLHFKYNKAFLGINRPQDKALLQW